MDASTGNKLDVELTSEANKISLKEDEVEVIEVKADGEETELDCCKAILMKANQLQYQLNILSSKVDNLQLQNQHALIEATLKNFSRELDEQMASIKAIQNLQSEEFQQKILEKDNMRVQLQENLEKQEQCHFQEIEELEKQLNLKDRQCLELEQQIEHYKGNNDINTTCPICFEQWNSSSEHRLVSLACGHLFGDKCIRNCLQQVLECPQCRIGADSNQIRYIYGRPL